MKYKMINITEKIERILNNMITLTEEVHDVSKSVEPEVTDNIRGTAELLRNQITQIQKELETI